MQHYFRLGGQVVGISLHSGSISYSVPVWCRGKTAKGIKEVWQAFDEALAAEFSMELVSEDWLVGEGEGLVRRQRCAGQLDCPRGQFDHVILVAHV